MTRQGFYFDMKACVGCRTCQVACKDKNDLPIGISFRHVDTYETGSYPSAGFYNVSLSCNHCEDPACIAVCPNGANYVDEEDGTVQYDVSKCIGCMYCVDACPYHAKHFFEDELVTKKCDACIELRAAGEQAACVSSCPMRALNFGSIDALRTTHPDAVDNIAALVDPSETSPSLAITARPSALESNFILKPM